MSRSPTENEASSLALRLKTGWCVITGAPCAGKTTVIDLLKDRGFAVVPEIAREYIDAQLSQGKSLPQIKADPHTFERHILLEKVRIESRLPLDRLLFLDRAVPDSVAYYTLEGLDVTEPLAHCDRVRYRKIFLFERFSLEADGVRSEDNTVAARIESLLEEVYRRLDYDLIRVPVLSPYARCDFVLRHSLDR
jgi:predicted ATPase